MDTTGRSLALATLSVLLFGGCNVERGTPALLSSIRVERAEVDADKAIAQGDRRLFGVYGYSREVPGVPDKNPDGAGACGLRMIEGTSDVLQQSDRRARAYALRYNQRVLSRTGCATNRSNIR